MRFNNHVSLTRDLCGFLDFLPTFPSNHSQLLFTPPAPPVPVPVGIVLEFIAPMYWLPGAYTGAHAFTDTVFHCHLTIAQQGHDLGPLLIHISVPPNDLLTQVNILGSSRKANFEAGEVKANGKAIACCTMFDLALIPTPMSPCAKLLMPTGGTGSAVLFNSVIVGMHWIDMLAGWVTLGINMLMSVVTFGAPGDLIEMFAPASLEFTGNIGRGWGGLIRLAGQQWADYHGDAVIQWTIASGWAGELGFDVTRSGEDGTWSGGVAGRYGPSAGNVHGSARVREEGPAELSGGAGVAGGDYGGTVNSQGETSSTTDHPHMPSGYDPVWGVGAPPTDESGDWNDSGASPFDTDSSWDDLPFL